MNGRLSCQVQRLFASLTLFGAIKLADLHDALRWRESVPLTCEPETCVEVLRLRETSEDEGVLTIFSAARTRHDSAPQTKHARRASSALVFRVFSARLVAKAAFQSELPNKVLRMPICC